MQFDATITSKGQVTLPAKLRARLKLNDGDKIEFYLDHNGCVLMRPRNRPALAFLDALRPRTPMADIASDEEAVTKAVTRRDARSRQRRRPPSK